MLQRLAFTACLIAALVGGRGAAEAAPAAPELKRPEAETPVKPGGPAGAAAPVIAALPRPAAAASEAQRYCQNVAAAAGDARFSLQTRKLNELESGIAKRVAELEAKEAELKEVLASHDEAMKRAQATLVAIYGKMKPDAAAQQIAALDDATAAAVLSSLNPRQSSAILGEIPAERAVKLVNTISTLVPSDGKKS